MSSPHSGVNAGGQAGLRGQATKGATFLAAREIAGVAIGLVGVVLLTRVLGPQAYGVYAAAAAFLSYLAVLGQWGMRVYLVRRPVEPLPQDYHQAFTLCLILGIGTMGLGMAAGHFLEELTRITGLASAVRVLFAALPGIVTVQVHRAVLERQLAFGQIAGAELLGQLSFYAIALPAAFLGAGYWAPVAGLWGQQLLIWLLVIRASRFQARLHWDGGLVRVMLREGLEFSAANWLWQGRALVNPVIVGRLLGPTWVGYVDLAVRFADNLSFFKNTATRVSLPILSIVQQDLPRLRRSIEEGTRWLMLPLGLALVVFAWVAPAAIPIVFGQLWSPALDVFPFIAFGYLAHALVTMQISALFVVRRHLEVAAVHALHLCMFAATAAVLVQRIGVVGYGAGEMAATLPFIWVQRVASRQFASPIHRTAVVWFIAFGAACFVRLIGWWMAIPLLLVLVSPSFWRDLRRLVRLWLDAWRPGRDLAEEGHGDGQEAPLRSGHRIDPAGQ